VQGWFLRLCDKVYVTIIAKYHQHEKPLSKEPGIIFRKVFKAILLAYCKDFILRKE
jgi:hypothetical protein